MTMLAECEAQFASSVSWRAIRLDGADAAEQMGIDDELARAAEPIVRLFRWHRPALSLGFRQDVPAWIDSRHLGASGIDLVERPTGGGIAVHGSDLSCAIVVPQSVELRLAMLMALVSSRFREALGKLGVAACCIGDSLDAGSRPVGRIQYCLTQPSPHALLAGSRKLCGFAVRRYPSSWLIQGSLLVRPLPPVFKRVMPTEVFAPFQERAVSLEEAAGRRIVDDELDGAIAKAWETEPAHAL